MGRLRLPIGLALIVLATAGGAGGTIGSSFSGGQLTVTMDGDSVALNCSGVNVKVNGLDPPGGAVLCSAVTRLIVHGDNGNDTIDLSGLAPAAFPNLPDHNVTVNAGGGNDVVTGSPLADTLTGDAGNDTIRGGAGGDTLLGDSFDGPQTGIDDLDGQDGGDAAVAGPGDTVVDSGGVDDYDNFIGTFGTSGADNVSVLANGSVVTAAGTAVRGAGFEITEIDGGAGNDILDASAATTQVVIDAGDGNDTLIGGSADDYLFGFAGNDSSDGRGGNDQYGIYSGDGADSIADTGVGDDDTVMGLGDAGNDSIAIGVGTLTVAAQVSTFSGVERFQVYGSGGDDSLDASGTTADVRLDGGDGNDTLKGGAGSDVFVLDGGVDSILDPAGAHDSIELMGAAATLDLSKQSGEIQNVSATQTLSLTGLVENLYGTENNDTLAGNAANNFIDGNRGDDTVSGGGGDDAIGFGGGADHADGGMGSDSYFAYSIVDASIADTGTSGIDVIDYDCASGALDTGSSLTAGGATLSYSGVENRRCGAFSDGPYEPIFTPQAAPPAPSPSGGTGSGAPTSSTSASAAPAPVVVRSRTANSVVATITAGSGGSLGLPASTTVAWTAATFPAGASLAASTAPAAASAGFSSGSVAIDLGFTVGGTPVHVFAAPIEITFPALGARLPAYSTDGGVTWTAIPRLGGTALPGGQADGFYVDLAGATHVLTRHATTFGLLGPVVVRSGVWVPATGPRRIVAFFAPERPATATVVLMTRAGKVVSRLNQELPARTSRLVFTLPRGARPGLYLVKAQVRSGPSVSTVVLRARVTARATK
jgi:Ca2+-binding RTX toxin-like protein